MSVLARIKPTNEVFHSRSGTDISGACGYLKKKNGRKRLRKDGHGEGGGVPGDGIHYHWEQISGGRQQ